jgi:hypothetical protein
MNPAIEDIVPADVWIQVMNLGLLPKPAFS